MSRADPEELLRCPYDGSHRVRAARFPYHLVKCRKNNPDKARTLESCPFNARHCIPKADMKHHITNCSDKKAIEDDFVSVGQRKHCEIPQSTWQCPPPEEDWERDNGDDTSATFVYGYSNVNQSCVKGSSISVYESNNNLAVGIRAPKTLPEQPLSSADCLGSVPFVLPWRVGSSSRV
ncbi:gametocyte-specific factor 1 [Callorhinchus milii]|uniref:Gametocyte-specific factor 1-like protein n=1 Tax=Callorhinchus milii TaxID=7868 RepID=V9L7K8_CALMI|nr:gametocyte-specific factor 1 [Callorhinchus milii]|eukprot:gi/632983531/ref/XP_007908693.1/ PREDICTED: gametocyte-specific factor 1 [Callorhinchus milii]